jgi:hypothetical protein
MSNHLKYLSLFIIGFIFVACSGEVVEEASVKEKNPSIIKQPPSTDQPQKEGTIQEPKKPTITDLQRALDTGESSKVTEDEIVNATLEEISAIRAYLQDAKREIFHLDEQGKAKADGSSLTAISWNPTHDAMFFNTKLGVNLPILLTNSVSLEGKTIYHKSIGAIGERGAGRYMVFGGNPMRVKGNDQMEQMLENAFAWLSNRNDLKKEKFKVVLAQLDDSYYFKDASKTRAWLDEHYSDRVSYNSEDSCDGSALQECLTEDTDLLIISQIVTHTEDIQTIVETVQDALEEGISVMYIHHDGDLKPLGKALFSNVFDIEYYWDNYFKRLALEDFDITTIKAAEELDGIETMFSHFQKRDFKIAWSACENDTCNEVPSYKVDFLNGAKDTQQIVQNLDKNKKNIFAYKNRYNLEKLLVLSGDIFRRSVRYPMDKKETDDTLFLKSLYADYASYNFRDINPVQPDLGNFSRSDFSHVVPHKKVVNLKSKKYFKAAGVYALPGKSVKITRLDDANLKVKVFINSLRHSATHEYAKNGYKRPKFLQSPHIEIASGESITITSAYGGPIELEFNANDLDVKLAFENIAEHPFWAGSEDSATFAQKLEEGNFDWAEIVTDGFEVHSTLEKMKKSLADTRWTDTEAFVEATKKYISNYPHALAGFKGEGVDAIAEVDSFANEHHITIETINIVKHMNADQATCGEGCSGNPYDAYWAFSPVAHGDLHELGHGLESGKFQFEGFSYHATTNPYSYYAKSKYHQESGEEPDCQSLPFKELFENLQKSIGEENPTAYLQSNFWATTKWSHQVLVTIEAMMATQKMGKLENGWHLLSRLHLLEREIKRARGDWENRKSDLGFDNYTLDEFNSLRKNDWLLISFSFASGLDFRDFFEMMGIPYEQKASEQVASFGYEKVPKKFYISTPNGYCKEDAYGKLLDKDSIDFSKSAVFPY